MASVEKDAYLKAAIIAGGSHEMDAVAHRLKGNLVTEAARHRLTGALSRSFYVKTVPGETGNGRLVDDRIVGSTDPDILSINYGHIAGKRESQTPQSTRVPGKHIFEKAIYRS